MDYIPYDESHNDERTVYPYYTVQDINTQEIRRIIPLKITATNYKFVKNIQFNIPEAVLKSSGALLPDPPRNIITLSKIRHWYEIDKILFPDLCLNVR